MAEANLSLRTNSVMCSFSSLGLGSNVSRWLGPPSMVRKMHALALAGICCGLGESTPARARSCSSSAESATDPIPLSRVRRLNLIDIYEFVGIKQRERQVRQRPHFRRHIA